MVYELPDIFRKSFRARKGTWLVRHKLRLRAMATETIQVIYALVYCAIIIRYKKLHRLNQ